MHHFPISRQRPILGCDQGLHLVYGRAEGGHGGDDLVAEGYGNGQSITGGGRLAVCLTKGGDGIVGAGIQAYLSALNKIIYEEDAE